MNAIISNGNYTARVQLPVERRQLSAEYANRSKALVLGLEGYYHPCYCPYHFGGIMGEAQFRFTCGSFSGLRSSVNAP